MQDPHDRLLTSTTVMILFNAMQDPKMKAVGQNLAEADMKPSNLFTNIRNCW